MSDVREQGLQTVPEACERPQEAADLSAVVAARDLWRRYGAGDAAVDALRGISIDIERGRFTAIMGPSGSGKSTLMHVLAGLDEPTSGTAWVDGTEITALKERQLTQLRRDKVGFIFQTFNLLPMLTARENLVLPLTIAGRKLDDGWLDTLVNAVDLGDRLGHRPSELSGGQQQRVAIARALVSDPAVVFADEPTGNLDSVMSHEIMSLLRTLNEQRGITIVLVTHEADIAAYAKRQVRFRDGQIHSDTGASFR